jgi:hypothetical protein
MIHGINLGVAFLLELAVLFAVGFWGFTLSSGLPLRLLAGIGTPALMAVLWGILAAPKASFPLQGAADAVFRIAWFGIGAVAFWAAGRPPRGAGAGHGGCRQRADASQLVTRPRWATSRVWFGDPPTGPIAKDLGGQNAQDPSRCRRSTRRPAERG